MNGLRRALQGSGRPRWRDVVAAGCVALLLVGAVMAPSPAVARSAGLKVNLSEIIPGHYIANYAKVARVCPDLHSYVWANWITYAGATLGDEWVGTASSATLCPLAAKSVNQMINVMAFRGGTVGSGSGKHDQEGYALLIEGLSHSPTGAPKITKSVPAGWKCFALQSFWGATAWNTALMVHAGTPGADQWGPASGPGAGSGFCVSGARKNATGAWSGGQFFTWAPDTRTCKARFKLKETPDPANPNDVKYPSYAQAQIWSDYVRSGC